MLNMVAALDVTSINSLGNESSASAATSIISCCLSLRIRLGVRVISNNHMHSMQKDILTTHLQLRLISFFYV